MRILIVNASDLNGGAARAAYRLHRALLSHNVDSQMLVQNKVSDDHSIIEVFLSLKNERNKFRKIFDRIPILLYNNRSKTLFSPSWLPFSSMAEKINKINPDIVHIHWINKGMMKIEDIEKIKSPIVWSLHDMWLFTGGCHYDEECEAFKSICGNCKVLNSNKEKDLSWRLFNRKKKSLSKKNDITIVGLSKWISNCAKNSTLLKGKEIINIPNPIDCEVFKPINKEVSRDIWNLPKDKKLVLFGAMNATSDPRKGFHWLVRALKKLKTKEIELVVFGCNEPEKSQNLEFKTHYLGQLKDDISLVTLYDAVDVVLIPSLQENLSNTIMESLACGTPVVGFDIGGNADMIEHKKNGYLAKSFDVDDLAIGIEFILNPKSYNKFCQQARNMVLKKFNSNIVIEKYIKLYKSIIENSIK